MLALGKDIGHPPPRGPPQMRHDLPAIPAFSEVAAVKICRHAADCTPRVGTDRVFLGVDASTDRRSALSQLSVLAQLQTLASYSGGSVESPTYEAVCSGTTGHAEVIQITFDPNEISFDDLLKVFWQTHDPTTLNRQGHDVGTQYRSAVFYHSEQQKKLAEEYKRQLDAAGTFKSPIVTEIVPFEKFYPAEKYHQDYFELNPGQRYCEFVIRPKVEKFQQEFGDLLESK